MKKTLSLTVLLQVLILAPFSLSAQKFEESGKIEKSFSLASIETVEFLNKDGDIVVETWNENQARLEIQYLIKGDYKEDVLTIIDALNDIESVTNGSSITINTRFYSSLMEINTGIVKKVKMKIKGAGTVDLKYFEVGYVLRIPAGMNLKLKNHYGNVRIPDIQGDVGLDLYDCDLHSGNIEGTLKLKLRYTDAVLGNATDSDINLYDSDIEIQDLGNLTIVSKYSKININSCKNASIDFYDDKVTIGSLLDLKGAMKYTSLFTGNLQKTSLNIYDCVFEAGSTNGFELKSKYSKITLKNINGLFLYDLYDDKVNIGQISSMAGISKYASFVIGRMNTSLEMKSTYDDDIKVDFISKDFTKVMADGKYTSINLGIENGAAYYLNIKAKYTGIELDEKQYEKIRYIDKNDETDVVMKTKEAGNTNDQKASFNMYDGKLSIIVK